jgi:hypothetical protein
MLQSGLASVCVYECHRNIAKNLTLTLFECRVRFVKCVFSYLVIDRRDKLQQDPLAMLLDSAELRRARSNEIWI